MTGVTSLRQEWVFDHHETRFKNVIMLGVQHNYEELKHVPKTRGGIDVTRQYCRAAAAAKKVAGWLREQGWDTDIAAHRRRGGHVLGLCGGYQMLGRTIADPDGVDGPPGTVPGLGLLDVETVMGGSKQLARRTAAARPGGEAVHGYEIHMGRTEGPDCDRAWLDIGGRPEGAASRDGLVRGSYLHGVFAADEFRAGFLARLGVASDLGYEADVESTLDRLADHLERHMNIDLLLGLAAEPVFQSSS